MHGLPTASTRPARISRRTKSVPSRRTAPLPPADVGLVVTRQFYLRVLGVRDGSPAAKAGLQTGDFVRDDRRPADAGHVGVHRHAAAARRAGQQGVR